MSSLTVELSPEELAHFRRVAEVLHRSPEELLKEQVNAILGEDLAKLAMIEDARRSIEEHGTVDAEEFLEELLREIDAELQPAHVAE